MSYRLGNGPEVTLDTTEFERQIAQFCANNAITTDAQYQAGVNGIAAGSALELAAVKAILRSVHLVP